MYIELQDAQKDSLLEKIKNSNDKDKHICSDSGRIYIRFQQFGMADEWVEMLIHLSRNTLCIERAGTVTHENCDETALSCIRETDITDKSKKTCVIKRNPFCGCSGAKSLDLAEEYFNILLDWADR